MFTKRLIFLVVLVGLALAFAWSRIRVVELGYAVRHFEKEIEDLKEQNGLLKTRLANALSTQKLAALAKKYRMAPPRPDQIIFMEGHSE